MASTVELRAILRDEISAGLKAIEAELKRTGTEGRAAGAGISSGMSTALPTVRGGTDALGQQVAKLRAQRDAMSSPEYQNYARQQRETQREIDALTRAHQPLHERIMSVRGAMAGLVAFQVAGWAKDGALAIYEATAEMDSMSRGLTAVMGSSRLAANEMEKLKEVAKLPGLGYGEALRMSTSLQASGMSADMARKAMLSFGNALAVVGKGKAELDGVGLALSQIMSKGKVSAEEINQIAERVPQIRVAMQEAFGTANTELIGNAGLSARNFIAGVSDELGKLEKATGGLKNGTENLSDAWFRLKANIGGSGSVFAAATSAVANLVESMNKRMEDSDRQTSANMNEWQASRLKFMKEKQASGAKMMKIELAEMEVIRSNFSEQKKVNDAATVAAKARTTEDARRFREGLEKQLDSKKTNLAALLKMAEVERAKNAEEAKRTGTSLELVEQVHQANVKRIREEAAKKDKKPGGESGWSPAIQQAEREFKEKIRIEEAAKKSREDAYDRTAKREEQEEREKRARRIRYDRFELADEMRMEKFRADFAEEQYQARLKEEEDKQKLVDDHNAAIVASFMPVHGVVQQFTNDLLNGEASMESFQESFKQMLIGMASELAANAMLFGFLSLFSGGAAASFAGGLTGLSSLIFGQRATGGSATGGPMLIGERGAEIFTPTVPGSITNNSRTSYQGSTYNITISGSDLSPRKVADVLDRAERIRRDRRPGGSR